MTNDEKQLLIESYIKAYNNFDIDGMMEGLHPEVTFKDISGGQTTSSLSGKEELRKLAEQSKDIFSSREQRILEMHFQGDLTYIIVAYEGVLGMDLPNGMKAGQMIKIKGRSEFTFRDGLIDGIVDLS